MRSMNRDGEILFIVYAFIGLKRETKVAWLIQCDAQFLWLDFQCIEDEEEEEE